MTKRSSHLASGREAK